MIDGPFKVGKPIYPRALWDRLPWWRVTVKPLTPEQFMAMTDTRAHPENLVRRTNPFRSEDA